MRMNAVMSGFMNLGMMGGFPMMARPTDREQKVGVTGPAARGVSDAFQVLLDGIVAVTVAPCQAAEITIGDHPFSVRIMRNGGGIKQYVLWSAQPFRGKVTISAVSEPTRIFVPTRARDSSMSLGHRRCPDPIGQRVQLEPGIYQIKVGKKIYKLHLPQKAGTVDLAEEKSLQNTTEWKLGQFFYLRWYAGQSSRQGKSVVRDYVNHEGHKIQVNVNETSYERLPFEAKIVFEEKAKAMMRFLETPNLENIQNVEGIAGALYRHCFPEVERVSYEGLGDNQKKHWQIQAREVSDFLLKTVNNFN